MANLNRVMLIGRLTRDPESHDFPNGGRVVSFGYCVNNRRKNPQTNEWEDEPVWIDCKAFDNATGRKLGSLIHQYCRKGDQLYVGGHLKLETWEDKNGGGKRQKLVVIVDDAQFLEPKKDGGNNQPSRQPAQPARAPQPARQPSPYYDEYADSPPFGAMGGNDDNIPF